MADEMKLLRDQTVVMQGKFIRLYIDIDLVRVSAGHLRQTKNLGGDK